MTSPQPAILATGVRKSFGDNVVLDGVDLDVAEGTIFALGSCGRVGLADGAGYRGWLVCRGGLDASEDRSTAALGKREQSWIRRRGDAQGRTVARDPGLVFPPRR
jgi:hypothetical protein